MERSTAAAILSQMKTLDGPLNAAMQLVEQIDDPIEKKVFRKALASVVGLVYTDVIVEILRRFPDLGPYDKAGP